MRAEEQEQMTVVNYLRYQYPNVLFNISPVNCTNAQQGVKNKRMGANSGCPDLMLFSPNKNYHGLFIELKTPEKKDCFGKVYQKKGVVKKHQQEYIDKLNNAGYLAVVCYGADSAIEIINSYLTNE